MRKRIVAGVVCAGLAAVASMVSSPWAGSPASQPAGEAGDVSLQFKDGYQTDRRDGGRPVVLIAAALNVPADVFREAFTHVTPARGRAPTREEAQKNKAALLGALGKYGVTNDRLDEVSNYYRYRPQNGELWTHRAAAGVARIEGGRIVSVKLTDAGAGYSSPPRVSVPGHPELRLIATVAFGTDLKTNGRLDSVKVVEMAEAPTTQP